MNNIKKREAGKFNMLPSLPFSKLDYLNYFLHRFASSNGVQQRQKGDDEPAVSRVYLSRTKDFPEKQAASHLRDKEIVRKYESAEARLINFICVIQSLQSAHTPKSVKIKTGSPSEILSVEKIVKNRFQPCSDMKSKVDPFHFDTKQSLQSQSIEKEKTFNYHEIFLNVCSLPLKEQRIVNATVNQGTYHERLQWSDIFNSNYRM